MSVMSQACRTGFYCIVFLLVVPILQYFVIKDLLKPRNRNEVHRGPRDLDLAMFQDFVSRLNTAAAVRSVRSTGTGTGTGTGAGAVSNCSSAELLPFGALPSDWTRLLLLQKSLPEGTPLYENLVRLSRLMLSAHFESEDRANWQIRLSDDDYGSSDSNISKDSLIDPYAENQKVNAVILNLAAEKENTSSNVNLNVRGDAHKNKEPLKDENFSENEDDQTTVSYYDLSSFTDGTTNFDPAFFDFVTENEIYENKSNETFERNTDENGSFQTTIRTFEDSFISTTLNSNEVKDDKNYSSSFFTTEEDFASWISSDEEILDNSANEAIHERSKEKFVVSRLKIKNNKEKSEEESNSVSLSAQASDENISALSIDSVENPRNQSKNWTDLSINFDSASNNEDNEKLLSQSVEDFFALENESNYPDISNLGKNENQNADYIETKHSINSENKSSEESLLTKSIEDFFAFENDSNETVTAGVEIGSRSNDNSYEVSTETNKFMKIVRDTIVMTENLLKVNGEENEITTRVPFSEWDKVNDTDTENEISATNWTNINEIFNENFTSTESIPTELTLSTTLNISCTTQSSKDLGELQSMETDVSFQPKDELGIDELISSIGDSFLNTSNSDDFNSTVDEKNGTNPTTLVQLVSKGYSDIITAMNLRETTEKVDLMSSILNETEDRSAKSQNIPAAISQSLRNTMNHNQAGGQARIFETEFDEDFENRTTNLTDDKTAIKRRPENDWSSTTRGASIELQPTQEVTNISSEIIRNILMRYRHYLNKNPSKVTKLIKVEDSSDKENEGDYEDKKEGDINTWTLESEDISDLPADSLRHQESKRNYEITADAKTNKRKSHKRLVPNYRQRGNIKLSSTEKR